MTAFPSCLARQLLAEGGVHRGAVHQQHVLPHGGQDPVPALVDAGHDAVVGQHRHNGGGLGRHLGWGTG